MRTGPEYIHSHQKRVFDLAIVGALTPTYLVLQRAVQRQLEASGLGGYPIFEQERVGQAQKRFVIYKLMTMRPGTETSFSRFANLLRRSGGDEVAQIRNIREGNMSAVGYRPLISVEFERVSDNLGPRMRQEWHRVIEASKPGALSSYGIEHHIRPEEDPNEADIRAEMDIQDFWDASLAHDIGLFGRLAVVAAQRRLF